MGVKSRSRMKKQSWNYSDDDFKHVAVHKAKISKEKFEIEFDLIR